jgi:hypothetical protein
VEALELQVRNATYRTFVELGRAPTAHDIADRLDLTLADVEACWRRLHDLHAIVLEPDSPTLRMANPFSAVPTRFRVRAAGRWWDANCAWDAFGICAALHVDGRITTSCPDCEAPLRIDVVNEQPSDTSLLFHSLVPAAQWWDDIAFT